MRSKRIRRLAIALGALGLAIALAPTAASAATITVSAGGDGAGCTLRNASLSANGDSNSGGCVATDLPYGNDTVQIPGSIASPIQLVGTPLAVSTGAGNDLTINGSGASALDVRGGASFRVLTISGAGTTVISNLTISHGNVVGTTSASGGAINFSGNNLTLDHVVVSQNTATANDASGAGCGAGFACASAAGAGIYYGGTGTLTIRDSTISNNPTTATSSGSATTNTATALGAVTNTTSGSVVIERSTLSGNTATANPTGNGIVGQAYGGALEESAAGSTTIKNSTLSGNQAIGAGGGTGHGGAISTAASGGTLLQSDTITKNTAASGANVFNGGNTTTTKSTIVSNPQTGSNCANSGGTFTSAGFNLEDTNTCNFNQGTDHPSTATGLDPNLASNGGPTETHALLPGSAAIDKGSSFGESLDQRNLTRVADFSGIANPGGGDGADIGAFEFQLACPGQPVIGGDCPQPPPSSGTTSGPTSSPGPTSLRAAALAKCKKKHGQARRNCRKRANKLPL